MALINCPECNTRVSDMALNCPTCGYPIEKYVLAEKTKDTIICEVDFRTGTRINWSADLLQIFIKDVLEYSGNGEDVILYDEKSRKKLTFVFESQITEDEKITVYFECKDEEQYERMAPFVELYKARCNIEDVVGSLTTDCDAGTEQSQKISRTSGVSVAILIVLILLFLMFFGLFGWLLF